MSAIPNLPETVIDTNDSNSAAASRHLLNTQGAQANGDGHSTQAQTGNQWQLHDAPVENQRPIKVIVIGAGYSGLYMGIRIPERLRNCELVIYEKNPQVGGTWYENRYPGKNTPSCRTCMAY